MTAFIFLIAIIVIIAVVSRNSKRSRAQRQQQAYQNLSKSNRIDVIQDVSPSGYRLRDYVYEPHTPARSTTPIEWFGKGAKLIVGRFEITDALVYSSASTPKNVEASCIDRSLTVGMLVSEDRGALGYWPAYDRISADQRANYLHWLNSGKKELLNDVGYVFLYFYGLERRALIDKQDIETVLDEVLGLTQTYQNSGSLNGYSSSYVAYLCAEWKLQPYVLEHANRLVILARASYNLDLLSVILHAHNESATRLPPFLAQVIAEMDPLTGRSVVPKRFPEEFAQLFAKKYELRHGEGIELRVSKKDRVIDHRLASGTLGRYLGYEGAKTRIPDVLGIPSQFKDLTEIYNLCIEELRPLSRKVGTGMSIDSREAYAALPPELQESTEHPDTDKWKSLADSHRQDDGIALVEVGKLAALLDIDQRDKLTLKQTRDLADTAQHVGFVIEPDGRILNTSYDWDTLVALFKDDEILYRPTEPHYLAACVVLQLGLWVAAADGHADEEELAILGSFLEELFTLAPHESKRLEAQKKVLLLRPTDQVRLGKRLQEALTPDQRKKLGELLVAVAAATNGIDESEWKALRKAFRSLDLGMEHLDAIIATVLPESDKVATVRPGSKGEPGEPLPPRTKQDAAPTIHLDAQKLKEILDNTREVTAILASVFVDESPLPEETIEVIEPERNENYPGLEERYCVVLDKLLSQSSWSDSEFDQLMSSSSLMRLDVIEQINLWAYDTLGDNLIMEDGGQVIIQTDLIENNA